MHGLDLHVVVVFVVGWFVCLFFYCIGERQGAAPKTHNSRFLGTSYKYTFVMLHCTGGQFRSCSPDADDGIVENFSGVGGRCMRTGWSGLLDFVNE